MKNERGGKAKLSGKGMLKYAAEISVRRVIHLVRGVYI